MSKEEQWQVVGNYMAKGVFFENNSVTDIQEKLKYHKETKHEIVASTCQYAIKAKQSRTYILQQNWVLENQDKFNQYTNEQIQNAIRWLDTPPLEWFLASYVLSKVISQNARNEDDTTRKQDYQGDAVVGKFTIIKEESNFVLMRACLQRLIQIRNEISEV
jgi:hypothetical protein